MLNGIIYADEHARGLGDESLLAYVREAANRGLIDVDLADVAPARLAAALLATPAGRSAIAAHMVSRRHSNGHEKPEELVEAIRADVAGGLTIYATSKKHGVAFNTVKRYVAEGKKLESDSILRRASGMTDEQLTDAGYTLSPTAEVQK